MAGGTAVIIILSELVLYVYDNTESVLTPSQLSGHSSYGIVSAYGSKTDASLSQNSIGNLISIISDSQTTLLGSKPTINISFTFSKNNGDQISFGYSATDAQGSLPLGLVPGQKIKMSGFVSSTTISSNLGKTYDVSTEVSKDGKFLKLKFL